MPYIARPPLPPNPIRSLPHGPALPNETVPPSTQRRRQTEKILSMLLPPPTAVVFTSNLRTFAGRLIELVGPQKPRAFVKSNVHTRILKIRLQPIRRIDSIVEEDIQIRRPGKLYLHFKIFHVAIVVERLDVVRPAQEVRQSIGCQAVPLVMGVVRICNRVLMQSVKGRLIASKCLLRLRRNEYCRIRAQSRVRPGRTRSSVHHRPSTSRRTSASRQTHPCDRF